MDLRQLRSFVALAETLHFGRAAQRLNITQPPLSRQIAALEKSVGTDLFIRHSRSVALTPAGMSFYESIRRLLDDLKVAVGTARAAAVGERGELKVAFSMYAAWNVLPELISAFAEAYPDVSLVLNETLPCDLAQALNAGEADVGITFPLRLTQALCYQPLYQEPLCAVIPEQHPLAHERSLSVGDLAAENFVTFPSSTAPALHEAVISCCRRHDFEPTIRVEAHLQQTIVNLVAKGLGVALVPDSMRRMQLQGAIFLPLQASPLIEQGVYWNSQNDNPCLKNFIRCLSTLNVHGPLNAPPI